MGEAAAGFSSAAQGAEPLDLPRAFGRLLLLKLLARGGMGDVYLAATTGIEGAERACIVKTVRRDHIHDGSFLARFLDEARVQSQLNHPGVAQVLEAANDENGEPFTVVEYVEGRALSELRQRAIQLGAKITWADAVAIALEIAQALAHVHERSGPDGTPLGIVHRDLSPQNVMLGYGGDVKLIDFGTARGHNRRCHTVAGVVFAKPGYVAPEVARQQVGDGRIDVYALGIMLWELAAGRRFLTGDAQKHLEEAAAGKVLVPAVAKSSEAPPLLDEVIQRLTANDPDDRYASATKAVADLAKLLAMAPAGKGGERGVRPRVASLMRALWPHEPAKSRAEFAKLLKEARGLRRESGTTPSATRVVESVAAQMAPSDPNLLPGTPYRLVERIGEGASGVVFQGEHTELGRKVAIKVLLPEHATTTEAIERFRHEARAVANLSHPNIVQLYDFGKALDGRVFLAMELLAGETLDRRLARAEGALPWQEAVKIGVEATRALEAAHAAGLVHRDLKPANLFLLAPSGPSGAALKLVDFGVAMALTETVEATGDAPRRRQRGFAVFGTPEYMAPEQVSGSAVDGRCDIYALGCVLYELITGARVFEGGSAVTVMGRQLRERPEPPCERAPERRIPPELDEVIVQALAKNPADRFASAAAFREALEGTLEAPARRSARARRKVVVWTTGVLTLALASVGAAHLGEPGASIARFAPLPARADADRAVAMAPSAETPVDILPAAFQDAPPPVDVETLPTAPPTNDPSLAAPVPAASDDPSLSPQVSPERAERLRDLAAAQHRAHGKANDPRALRAWAVAAYRAGDYREARHAADAWALKDGTVEPQMFIATLLETIGKKGEARNVLTEWLEEHPDSGEAKKELARLSGQREIARK